VNARRQRLRPSAQPGQRLRCRGSWAGTGQAWGVLLVDTTSQTVTVAPSHRRRLTADARFWLAIAAATGVGAVVRFTYLFHGAPTLVVSDGFLYHIEALGLADGLGYTMPTPDGRIEWAHSPPGWVTFLAAVVEAGWRSMRAHQATGLLIGLGVVIMAGLVGRRYAGRRVGVIAAFLAAAYPGFWVLEAQILSEALGLFLAGTLMLVLADAWERPTLARSSLAGALAGLLTLVRSEQLLLLFIAVVPILVLNGSVAVRRRLLWAGAATLTTATVIAPWAVHNIGRFEEPVVLSTNVGYTFLAGNCPPVTYGGDLIGSYDFGCNRRARIVYSELDESQRDAKIRGQAFAHMRANVERLPPTIAARFGRLLAVFRPSQTVSAAAAWAGSATWPVWAWVVSFWFVAPLAAYGWVQLRRSRTFHWPLVAPVFIVLLVVTVTYGEPRYHTMADLGLVVLAAVALTRVARHDTWSRRAG
jgi:4-amino-4-deoxy-L-arabinose transferase-like glycosyltransferase